MTSKTKVWKRTFYPLKNYHVSAFGSNNTTKRKGMLAFVLFFVFIKIMNLLLFCLTAFV